MRGGGSNINPEGKGDWSITQGRGEQSKECGYLQGGDGVVVRQMGVVSMQVDKTRKRVVL